MAEREIARSLHEQKYEGHGGMKSKNFEIAGVKVSFPYYTDIASMSAFQFIDPFMLDQFEACQRIMDPDTMPSSWVEVLKEADMARRERGSDIPIDLINGVQYLSSDSDRYKAMGLPQIPCSDFTGPDFTDEEHVIEAINGALMDPQLRQELIAILSTQIPDYGWSDNDMEIVKKIFRNQGTRSGLLIDLGCGAARRTPYWSQATGLTTIGMDRIYRNPWYQEHWNKKINKKLQFTLADFTQGIPFAEGTIDGIIMEDVVGYVLEDNLTDGISEITRVLKPETGLFFVGPQLPKEGYEQLRIFRKEKDETGNKYSLVEHSEAELLKRSKKAK